MSCTTCPRRTVEAPRAFEIRASRDIVPEEVAALMHACGHPDAARADLAAIERALDTYTLVLHARAPDGALAAYASAFCDGVFAAWVADLLVDPRWRRHGIGSRLVRGLETRMPDVTLRFAAPASAQGFLARLGYNSHNDLMLTCGQTTLASSARRSHAPA